jgi:DNA-binding FrmR family transcriptional regulator
VQEQKEALERALEEAKTEALADVEGEIEEVRAAFDEAIEEFEASIGGLRERMTDLQKAILERLRQARGQVDLADYPLPEGRQAHEGNDGLYDSSRNYLDQLDYYKRYRQHGVEE